MVYYGMVCRFEDVFADSRELRVMSSHLHAELRTYDLNYALVTGSPFLNMLLTFSPCEQEEADGECNSSDGLSATQKLQLSAPDTLFQIA